VIKNKQKDMLIVKVKDGDKIDKALKQFKNKVRRTKQMEQLREREQFQKPSEKKRKQKLKSIYKEKKNAEDSN